MAGPPLGGAGGFGAAGGGAAAGGAGGVGCCGGAAAGGSCGGGAAGGAGRGGGAAAGGTGRAGGAAAGGAGLADGAAAGGAGWAGGAALGGAPFGGAPFGGGLGFPSGPTSAACATTSGAVCACDGAVANCIAVRAVVASSTRRSLIMMAGIPRKKIFDNSVERSRISVRPDCGGVQRRVGFYFWRRKVLTRRCSLRIQAIISNRSSGLSPAHTPAGPNQSCGSDPGICALSVSG